jgi:uncharacterized protein YchJ
MGRIDKVDRPYGGSKSGSNQDLIRQLALKRAGIATWLYAGEKLPPKEKPTRNSPCECGSGKKRKKCHGKDAT